MEDYQERVVKEQRILNKKVKKLEEFMKTEDYPKVDKEERCRLERQFELTIESRTVKKAMIEPEKLGEAAAVLKNLGFRITEIDGVEVIGPCTCGKPMVKGEAYIMQGGSQRCIVCAKRDEPPEVKPEG